MRANHVCNCIHFGLPFNMKYVNQYPLCRPAGLYVGEHIVKSVKTQGLEQTLQQPAPPFLEPEHPGSAFPNSRIDCFRGGDIHGKHGLHL